MNIQSISRRLSELQFVEEAGAAPTDIGNIPCWQIKLTSLLELNDKNLETVREIVREESGVDSLATSKDIVGEGTDYELPCFWVLAYDVIETETIGGIEYDIVEYNPQGGVTALASNYGDPLKSIKKFKLDEVDFEP